jgi:phage baseplate assembly protein W
MADSQQFFNSQIMGKSDEIYDYNFVIGGTGDLTRLSGINVLINSLRNLLLTPLGHYPFDPEYGSLLYKKLFEPSDKITQQSIEYEIKIRVQRYDDRIKIQTVQFTWSKDRKTVSVSVVILRNGVTGKIDVTLSDQQAMFGQEDSITAVNNDSVQTTVSSSSQSTIVSIYDLSTTKENFIIQMQSKYTMMSLDMIENYWSILNSKKGKPNV